MHRTYLALLFLAALPASSAVAETLNSELNPPGSVVESTSLASSAESHEGWYLRLSQGVGAAGRATDSGRSDHLITSNTAAVGHSVSDSAILFLEFGAHSLYNTPEDQQSYGSLGFGLAYYTQSNWYATASLGFGVTFFPSEQDDVDTGHVAALGLGHEWWTSDAAALGIGAQLTTYRLDAETMTSGLLVGTLTVD